MDEYFIDSQRVIREVVNYPCLYNPRCEEYKNRPLKNQVWALVTRRVLGEDKYQLLNAEGRYRIGKEVQKRWKSLRDAYARTLRSEDRKPYVFHKQMTFLNPFIQSKLNPDDFVEVSVEEQDAPVNLNIADPPPKSSLASSLTELLSSPPSNDDSSIQFNDHHQDIKPNARYAPNLEVYPSADNEFDYFCKCLAVQLKNMPRIRAVFCLQRLQQVVAEEILYQINTPEYTEHVKSIVQQAPRLEKMSRQKGKDDKNNQQRYGAKKKAYEHNDSSQDSQRSQKRIKQEIQGEIGQWTEQLINVKSEPSDNKLDNSALEITNNFGNNKDGSRLLESNFKIENLMSDISNKNQLEKEAKLQDKEDKLGEDINNINGEKSFAKQSEEFEFENTSKITLKRGRRKNKNLTNLKSNGVADEERKPVKSNSKQRLFDKTRINEKGEITNNDEETTRCEEKENSTSTNQVLFPNITEKSLEEDQINSKKNEKHQNVNNNDEEMRKKEYEEFGNYTAKKLQQMNVQQAHLAQFFINNILIKGVLNCLTEKPSTEEDEDEGEIERSDKSNI